MRERIGRIISRWALPVTWLILVALGSYILIVEMGVELPYIALARAALVSICQSGSLHVEPSQLLQDLTDRILTTEHADLAPVLQPHPAMMVLPEAHIAKPIPEAGLKFRQPQPSA
ncbi:hypothetical protein ISS40_07915 [Candidatus Bathyarchaeota archaeon]|nr:hypothetical protein [Candidatus Bathyarchaeota archaeon]